MNEPRRVLLLGGTGDSRALAERLAALDSIEVISSLAGRTEAPLTLPGSLRIGGFGGVEALARYLKEERIDLLVDATHPFAERISDNAEAACQLTETPRLVLQREAWRPVTGDHWITVPDAASAAEKLPGLAERVFLTVGRQELAPFEKLTNIWFLVRMIDAPRQPLGLAKSAVVLGRGPFDEAGERDLMQRHRIDALVTKNSGGEAVYAKIAVARALGLPVVMIERPQESDVETAASVDAALDWISERL